MTPEERGRRARLAQAVLDIHRALLRYDDSAALTLTTLAVALGWYTGRKLDISSLAGITGLPRQTVSRHLSTLESAGFVQLARNTRWVYPVKVRKRNPKLSALYLELEAIFSRSG